MPLKNVTNFLKKQPTFKKFNQYLNNLTNSVKNLTITLEIRTFSYKKQPFLVFFQILVRNHFSDVLVANTISIQHWFKQLVVQHKLKKAKQKAQTILPDITSSNNLTFYQALFFFLPTKTIVIPILLTLVVPSHDG